MVYLNISYFEYKVKKAQIQVGVGMVSVVVVLGAVQHLLGCLLWVVVYLNIFYFYLK